MKEIKKENLKEYNSNSETDIYLLSSSESHLVVNAFSTVESAYNYAQFKSVVFRRVRK